MLSTERSALPTQLSASQKDNKLSKNSGQST